MTPVRLEFSADDCVSALKLHVTWSPHRWLVHLALILGATAVLFASFPAWPAVVAGGVLGGAVGSLACYGLLWAFYLPWKARRMFGQQKSLHERYELTGDADGLSVHGPRVQGTARWNEYLREKDNERLALAYRSDLLFQMLPRRVFGDEQWRSIRPPLDRIGG